MYIVYNNDQYQLTQGTFNTINEVCKFCNIGKQTYYDNRKVNSKKSYIHNNTVVIELLDIDNYDMEVLSK